MLIFKAVVLGIIQGFTEFLPISSSGHLVLGRRLLGFELPGISFEVAVHIGTLLAVLVVYGKDLWGIAKGALAPGDPAEGFKARRLALFLVVGSIPAAIAGIGLKGTFEALFQSLLAVGISLIITGTILRITGSMVSGKKTSLNLGLPGALLVGAAQALAIVPGISRSGSTVGAALALGLKPSEAARFSFLLSVPAVAGAAAVDIVDANWEALPSSVLLVGGVAAFTSGYVAIRALLWVLGKGHLGRFSYYCFLLGGVAMAWHALGL